MTLPNGDPGTVDPFDGGCPADTIAAQVITAPQSSILYAMLSVYPPDTGIEPDITECKNYEHAEFMRRARAAAYPHSNHHVVRIPVPAYVKPEVR